MVSALAELIAVVDARQKDPLDLVLTGGETARSVLDPLSIDSLSPQHEIEYGAVLSVEESGRYIVTWPGSFGGVRSLLSITDFLTHVEAISATTSLPQPSPSSSLVPSDNEVNAMSIESTPPPLIAVTMGDGAGVGREVIVPALLTKKCVSAAAQ